MGTEIPVKFMALRKTIRWMLFVSGILFFIVLLLAFTTQPFWMYYRLGTSTAEYRFVPSKIIVLGGAGMPSEANLMRCYTAAQLAERFPKSVIIVALTKDSSERLSECAAWKMQQELVLRGVDSSRIQLETAGRNTHEQAENILNGPVDSWEATVIVTSPEHIYRSLLTFRRAGLRFVGGQAAFEKTLVAELRLKPNLKGAKETIPGMTDELQYRYQFWNHLKYQVVCYREYVALLYYRINGWI
ncbi:MAG: hypothetical protein RL021_14 [Bacteroidota bacterium]|jgi:uncharacterized SAM-binding protein YcdF (DUF218 family)